MDINLIQIRNSKEKETNLPNLYDSSNLYEINLLLPSKRYQRG